MGGADNWNFCLNIFDIKKYIKINNFNVFDQQFQVTTTQQKRYRKNRINQQKKTIKITIEKEPTFKINSFYFI